MGDFCYYCDGTGERDFLSGAPCHECNGTGWKEEDEDPRETMGTSAIGDVVMPWDARAVELESVHGPYCVYAAWCEWFDAWNDRQSESMQLDVDGLDKTALFSAFMSACSGTRLANKGDENDQSIQ